MATLSPARRVALDALLAAADSKRYVRELMPGIAAAQALDSRDAAFALKLAIGVTACEGCLDDALNMYVRKPSQVELDVRMALRVSAYEAIYLKTEPSVVVSQGVELARGRTHAVAALANAVLRRVCEGRAAFLAADDASSDQREIVSAARRSGLPVWLVRRLRSSLGRDGAAALLAAQDKPAPLSIHVCPKVPLDVLDALQADGAQELSLPGAYKVSGIENLLAENAFERAAVVASDFSAQLVAAAATRRGSCLEIGAGRGTKTFMMHAHAQRARFIRTHIALDLSEGKCRSNAERIEHAGWGTLCTVTGDATDLDAVFAEAGVDAMGEYATFDTVFVDAPCSGTGTMRRHSEIPWRLTPQVVDRDLPELQLKMLLAAARRVAVAGELIYATCSVLASEDSDVIDGFLATETGSRFELAPVSQADIFTLDVHRQAADAIRLHEDERGIYRSAVAPGAFDGHFCARLIRRR